MKKELIIRIITLLVCVAATITCFFVLSGSCQAKIAAQSAQSIFTASDVLCLAGIIIFGALSVLCAFRVDKMRYALNAEKHSKNK